MRFLRAAAHFNAFFARFFAIFLTLDTKDTSAKAQLENASSPLAQLEIAWISNEKSWIFHEKFWIFHGETL